jgi:ABC-type sugar transport system ATPase subunit
MSQDNYNSKTSNLYHTKDQVDAVRFLTACQADDMDTLKQMIFEENYEYNNATKAYFAFLSTEQSNVIKQLFEQRELNKELNKDLPVNNTEDKRPKI